MNHDPIKLLALSANLYISTHNNTSNFIRKKEIKKDYIYSVCVNFIDFISKTTNMYNFRGQISSLSALVRW